MQLVVKHEAFEAKYIKATAKLGELEAATTV